MAQVEAKLEEGLEGLRPYLDPIHAGAFTLATQLLRLQIRKTWSTTKDKVYADAYSKMAQKLATLKEERRATHTRERERDRSRHSKPAAPENGVPPTTT
jgi:hypothetical protein